MSRQATRIIAIHTLPAGANAVIRRQLLKNARQH